VLGNRGSAGPAMKILFVSKNPYVPELRAGMEITTHYQCKQLIDRGHNAAVAVTTGTPSDSVIEDRTCGYPAYRSTTIRNSVAAAFRAIVPDVVVLLGPSHWANSLADLISGIPIVLYQHWAYAGLLDLDPRIATSWVVATSPDCASRLLKENKIPSVVVPPVFGIDRFADTVPNGKSVLFVSLQNRKGADVAMNIAMARPAMPFIFVESWTMSPSETTSIRERLSRLPNVRVLPNQEDLAPILAETKLLLMPSRSQEAWGRMASEAQACGIPVLASSRGQLPATVGKGGICLDPDEPLSNWLSAFDRMMNDPDCYDRLSTEARDHAANLLGSAKAALEKLETVLNLAASTARPNVRLIRKPITQITRPAVTLRDVRTALRLCLAWLQSWFLPQKLWPRTANWTSAVGAALAGRSCESVRERMRAELNLPPGEATALAKELRSARHEVALQCLRGFRPGGWNSNISVLGLDPLLEALETNRGCVLWVAHFVFAANVVKLAMCAIGLPVAHISRPDHGFSSSRFGIRVLNPLRTRFEQKYLSERIVFDRSRPLPAMRRAKLILDKGGLLSLTAGAWEGGHLACSKFLVSHLSLATGPIALARNSSSILLPVFAVRTGKPNDFLVQFGSPIDVHCQNSQSEAMTEGTAGFMAQLAPWVFNYPGQWRGWSSMGDHSIRYKGFPDL
jgi:glycosyltransferase involved in cell wall biosynthesis/lauroyl/myristoyl acyltransferase